MVRITFAGERKKGTVPRPRNRIQLVRKEEKRRRRRKEREKEGKKRGRRKRGIDKVWFCVRIKEIPDTYRAFPSSSLDVRLKLRESGLQRLEKPRGYHRRIRTGDSLPLGRCSSRGREGVVSTRAYRVKTNTAEVLSSMGVDPPRSRGLHSERRRRPRASARRTTVNRGEGTGAEAVETPAGRRERLASWPCRLVATSSATATGQMGKLVNEGTTAASLGRFAENFRGGVP